MVWRLRFFNDYESGLLWADDDPKRDRFGDGPVNALLTPYGMTADLLAERDILCALHAASLAPYPPDPTPWSRAAWVAYNARLEAQFRALEAALAPDIALRDDRMVLTPEA